MNSYKKQRIRKAAIALAGLGNRIISFLAGTMILFLLVYGGYTLWDTAMLYKGAFLSDDLMKFKPSNENDMDTLQELLKINPDVRGWLTVDDTNIDYPVVQGKTDLDYINKDVYGEFSFSGSIFLDSRNTSDFSDNYNLIYGHHMSNGAMFGDIINFTEKDYFDTHRTGCLYLTDEITDFIELFACMETDAFDEKIFCPDSWRETDLSSLLSYIREKSVQYYDIGIDSQDKILALSTCAKAETNGRVVLIGRLKQKSS